MRIAKLLSLFYLLKREGKVESLLGTHPLFFLLFLSQVCLVAVIAARGSLASFPTYITHLFLILDSFPRDMMMHLLAA